MTLHIRNQTPEQSGTDEPRFGLTEAGADNARLREERRKICEALGVRDDEHLDLPAMVQALAATHAEDLAAIQAEARAARRFS